MTDAEKLEKLLEYVTEKEDLIYKSILEGKHAEGSISHVFNMAHAAAFQALRLMIEELMEGE